MTKIKPEYGWFIFSPGGWWLSSHVRYTRKEAIKAFLLSSYCRFDSWVKARKDGFFCAKMDLRRPKQTIRRSK